MADVRKIVKVFLASPGDLQDERRAVKSVVDEFNKQWSEYLGYHVELVGWEDTVSIYGRPQATINRDLERCEFFIGMMWKRWGTKPGVDSKYSSGFEEEYETSVKRRKKTGRPEISLFFKKVDRELISDPGSELTKVLKFKERIGKQILFETFDDTRQFEAKIQHCITSHIQRLKLEEADTLSGESQAQPKEPTVDIPLSQEDIIFLREFIDKTERVSETESINAAEVARFRLLAGILGTQGNDDHILGSHDSNLIFSNRSALTLSGRELIGLIDCGLENYEAENTPLWHWYEAAGGFHRKLLSITSITGSSARRRGALRAMRLISETLPLDPKPSREFYIQTWFAKEYPGALKTAAMEYLGEYGQTSDLPLIKQEFDRGDYQISSPAINAIIRISLRDSRETTIKALYDLQPDRLDQSLLEEIFDNTDSISTELFSQGLDHRNPEVRRIVVKLLRMRGALTVPTAEGLLSDDDADVRFEGLQTLIDKGRSFSDDSVKNILVKPRVLGLLSLAMSEDRGDACWRCFCQRRMEVMPDQELQNATSGSWIASGDALFAWHERHFDSLGDTLRDAVKDNFVTTYTKALEDAAGKFGAQIATEIKEVEESLRKDLTQRGLDIICRKGSAQDLGLVRDAIRSGFLDYSDVQVKYLERFGEWEDISLIIASIERRESGNSLLWSPDKSRYAIAACAIYTIGRDRLNELLVLPMPAQLLSYLVAEASDKLFQQVNGATILGLFQSDLVQVRKAVALKCIRSLPKRRLKDLFDDYVSGNERIYYNVVHWLDFGASVPHDIAVRGAVKVAASQWPKNNE
jgi:hypothetical protein